MVGPGVPIAIALLGGRRCPARRRGHSLGSGAPAALDRSALRRSASLPAARQRPRADAEIVDGEVSFRTSLGRVYVFAPPGRRTVNTEPLPCSLVTVTSPPIMRASLRKRARPRPVPPKRCAVVASA